jgi:N-acetylneuraminic acid mutarotase
MFSAGGKLYIGAGLQTGTGVLYPTDDWYAYTPSTDQWTRVADMRSGATDAVQGAQAAVINNTAYLVCGEGYKCYQYNVATNTWSTMPDMIEERSHAGVAVYNQKLYTLKGLDYPDNGDISHDVFRYDPASNQWAYVPFRIDPSQLEENVAFVTGGKIYMLTYDAYGLTNKLYEGTTKLRQEFPGKYEQPIKPAPDPNAWLHARITVDSKNIKVYVNGGIKPSLIVEPLVRTDGKMIGLWAGGTDGDWKNLKITPAKE